MFSINYIAVLISLIVYTILGMLWYGPMFGKKWLVLSGMKDKDMNTPEMKKARTTGYITSLVSSLIAVFTLAVSIEKVGNPTALKGLIVGASLSFGLIAMTLVGEAVWHQRPWGLVAINSFYRITGLAISGLIIGIW